MSRPKKEERKVPVGVRLTPEVRAYFEEIAEADGRTLSNTIAITLENMAFGSLQHWRRENIVGGKRKEKTG